jgi:CubicO group peptidase (beta-lactamase class C family)
MESSENQNSSMPLTLDSRPQDFINASKWPVTISDPLYNITLRQLLSFTSGLTEEPGCITPGNPNIDFADCVANIATANKGNGEIPGAVFNYSSSHLQVAGLMAIEARNLAKGISNSAWQNLFTDFKSKTGTFLNSQYDLPSKRNPRLAGGMHWTGTDYFNFIQAYYNGQILSALPVPGQVLSLQKQQMSDQTVGAVIGYSPAKAGLGEDWHYGFGLWQECHAADFNCALSAESVSSPGAYGAYPFINNKNRFFGMVARQGAIGTFVDGYTSVYAVVEPDLIKWASKTCR